MSDLVLRLEVGARSALRATLRNEAARPWRVLRNADLQASELRLVRDGDEPEPADLRARRKFDRTAHRGQFVELPPGGEVLLQEGRWLRRADGLHDLTWGPFAFKGLAAGRWEATVAWTSELTTCAGADGADDEEVAGVWTGSLTSEPVELELGTGE